MEYSLIGKMLTICGLATFEIYAAIPMGFLFGLTPLTIFTLCVIGGSIGVFVTAYLGDKIRKFFTKGKTPRKKKTSSLATTLWEKYGVIGLGLLGTVTIGAPISIAVGIGFNANVHKLVLWCLTGVVIRCAAFTLIGHIGTQAVS